MDTVAEKIRDRVSRMQYLLAHASQSAEQGRFADCCEIIEWAVELETIDPCRNCLPKVESREG
jgi:hypothetical protein